MDDTDSFDAWLAMCIDEARAQDDMDAMLQEQWEKMNQEKAR